MSRGRTSKYSEKTVKDVLAYSEEHTISETSVKFGIPKGTIATWRGRKTGPTKYKSEIKEPRRAHSAVRWLDTLPSGAKVRITAEIGGIAYSMSFDAN